MNLKLSIIVIFFGIIGIVLGFSLTQSTQISDTPKAQNNETKIIATNDADIAPVLSYKTTHAGSYLSGHFAQKHHDWKSANTYIQHIISIDTENEVILLRAMVLAMGSGNPETAISIARNVIKTDPQNSLALLFLTSDSFKNKDYEAALSYVEKTPSGGVADFISPILNGWGNAAQGIQATDSLNKSSSHIYHAILIADYMGNHKEIEEKLQNALENKNIEPKDKEKIADIYAHISQPEKALKLYKQIKVDAESNKKIKSKIQTLESGEPLKIFQNITDPSHGVALALFETAQNLIQEYSDDSAQVFFNLALYLNPDMVDAKLLLAYISSRYKRYEEAIAYYMDISPEYEYYLQARREAASLWENIENYDAALAGFKALIDDHNDLQSIIESGNIYRNLENYEQAVKFYNQAAATFDKEIPKDYWHIYYLRGMSYERLGEWENAEKDLQKALSYQPNHPLVLNYLGYAWADQGDNLEKALDMISKATVLRPTDGFIKDSLGWVLYKMTRYKDAVIHLEKAIELMPYDSTINDHLGDAYWRTGRKLEANFQWKRALNFSKDEELIASIKGKLSHGLAKNSSIQEARTDQ